VPIGGYSCGLGVGRTFARYTAGVACRLNRRRTLWSVPWVVWTLELGVSASMYDDEKADFSQALGNRLL
jgi:hypothetical protein